MNAHENNNPIKNHWESMSLSYGMDLKSTTKNSSIKKLEINALSQTINYILERSPKAKTVLEIGCGNGYNCCALSKEFLDLNFTGVDYIANMIVNAKNLAETEGCKNINYIVGDILDINKVELLSTYDIVFTDRCIINLDTPEKQKQGIRNLVQKTTIGGHIIIIENSTLTYEKQNLCRELVGLEKRAPAQYNLFISESLIVECENEMNLKLLDIHDFGSLHDLFLYVILPKTNNGEIEYDSKIIEAITDFCIKTAAISKNKFGDFGQNRLYLLRKESEI